MLCIIGGIGGTVSAAMFGVFSATITDSMGDTMIGRTATFGGLVAGVLVDVSVLGFVTAGYLLLGNRWAEWTVIAFVVVDLSLESSVFGGNVFGAAAVLLDLFVLYYLYRPHVMECFGALSHKSGLCCRCTARDSRELYNHLIACERKNQNE